MCIAAVYNRTVYVSKSDIEQGMTYLFSVLMTVTVDGQGYQTRAGYMKTVNYQPYGGSCKISKTKGILSLCFARLLLNNERIPLCKQASG